MRVFVDNVTVCVILHWCKNIRGLNMRPGGNNGNPGDGCLFVILIAILVGGIALFVKHDEEHRYDKFYKEETKIVLQGAHNRAVSVADTIMLPNVVRHKHPKRDSARIVKNMAQYIQRNKDSLLSTHDVNLGGGWYRANVPYVDSNKVYKDSSLVETIKEYEDVIIQLKLRRQGKIK